MSKKKSAARRTGKLSPITILTKFELKSIRLVSSSSNVSLQAGGLPKATKVEAECGLGASDDEDAVKVNVNCSVISRYAESDSEPAIRISCEYQAVYKFMGNEFPSHDELSESVDDISNAAMIQVWPFIRHYAFWISSQIGVPPITLPMFRTETPAGMVGRIGAKRGAKKR